MAKTVTKTHASYWMDDDIWNDDDDVVVNKPNSQLLRVFRLSAARRATANFVNILTGKNDIVVRYSSGRDSYTDGKTVVIAADDNPENFDSMVGLALHEASHVLLSDFVFLQYVQNVRKDLNRNYDFMWHGPSTSVDVRTTHAWRVTNWDMPTVMMFLLHHDIVKTLPPAYTNYTDRDAAAAAGEPSYLKVVAEHIDYIKTIMNMLEDRRIDLFVYRTAGGYRPYYDALYERYMLNDDMAKNLRWNPEWRELTVDNYINRLLVMFHPAADPNALPGLKKLVKMVDLQNIERIAPTPDDVSWKTAMTYDSMPALWKVANELYVEILKYVKKGQEQAQSPAGGQPTISIPQSGNDSDMENLDLPRGGGSGMGGTDNENSASENSEEESESTDNSEDFTPREVEPADRTKTGKEKPRTFNNKRGNSMMGKLRDLVNDNIKKKKATHQEINSIQAVEDAAAQMVSIEGDGVPKAECIVTRKLTKQMLDQSWFIFGNGYGSKRVRDAIIVGRRMGRILEHKLQVRNDPVTTKYTRLQTGNIDRRLLANLGMDIVDIFQKSRIDSFKPAMLHLTIDASGSMHGEKWTKVISVATALAYVGSKVRNIDTVISLRGGADIPIVSIVFDSRKDTFATYMQNIPYLGPNGSTPEGLCFKATMNLILENAKTHDVYFINFSDGEPSFTVKANTSMVSAKRGRGRGWNPQDVYYTGTFATKHTRQQIQTLRDHGVKILSYYISHYDTLDTASSTWKMFREMYGEDAVSVNVQNAGQVLKTLNKRLTQKI